MPPSVALQKNIEFWHAYPELLVQGLTREQLRWQPEAHDTSIVFAIWHAYRATDELLHGLLVGRPSVFTSDGWAQRLPVTETGSTPFGNGASREQIGRIDLDINKLLDYAKSVGMAVNLYAASLTDEQAAEEISLPFFTGVYANVDRMSRIETIAFFAIGHVSEHLGEVQFIKGLLGMKGAPL